MKNIEQLEVKNKRVLVRVDFNVPLDRKGRVADDYRLREALPTIEYLKKNQAKIILISHLGKPTENKEPEFSLKQVVSQLEKLLKEKIKFLPDCLGEKTKKKINLMKPGRVILLENLRFYKGETKNDSEFAKKLAELGDIYINDAFSASHRAHASVAKLPEILPSAAGLSLQKEVKFLSKIKDKAKKPLVIIIGGKKNDKIESLPKLIKLSDYTLMNGFLSEIILVGKEILLGRPTPEKEILEAIEKINLTNPKFHLPKDVLISLEKDWTYKRIAGLGTLRREERVYDIGLETIEIYSTIIKKAGTIFWAGPLGFFEEERFQQGTKEVGEKIVRNYKAFKVAAGGDTISAIKKFGWSDKFDYISAGGGALLDFISGEKMPGIESLK